MRFRSCSNYCVASVDFLFFFFKQKTAYEMRISDWSSDVCSSDLFAAGAIFQSIGFQPADDRKLCVLWKRRFRCDRHHHGEGWPSLYEQQARSEEHTSELQSLMRISYAVFCLKKKKNAKYHKLQSTCTTINTEHITNNTTSIYISVTTILQNHNIHNHNKHKLD